MAKLKLKKNIKKRVGDLFICCLVAVIAYCSIIVGEFAYTRYNEYSSRKYISSLVGNKPSIDTKGEGNDPVDDGSFSLQENLYQE